jgi:ribonuclease H / adenosylcobalamin/alpha-ribazole phosphatase
VYKANFDGACRGNPGPASWGAIIRDPSGKVVASDHCGIGEATNNVAELAGLVWVLEWFASHPDARPARVCGDSMLAIRLASGAWKCHKPHLRALVERARELERRVRAELRWVPREQNTEADEASRS